MLNIFTLANGRLFQEEIESLEELSKFQPIWVDLESPTLEEKRWIKQYYGLSIPEDAMDELLPYIYASIPFAALLVLMALSVVGIVVTCLGVAMVVRRPRQLTGASPPDAQPPGGGPTPRPQPAPQARWTGAAAVPSVRVRQPGRPP